MENFEYFDINDLLARLEEDNDNFPDAITSRRIAEKIINSKSVFIGNSFHSEHFSIQDKYYHDKFVIVNKYFQQAMMFYVKKQKPFASEVHY